MRGFNKETLCGENERSVQKTYALIAAYTAKQFFVANTISCQFLCWGDAVIVLHDAA